MNQRRGTFAGREPSLQPVRHSAGVAVRRARDLDDDRLSRHAGDRGHLSEGHPRFRCRCRARRDDRADCASYGLGEYIARGYVPIDKEPEAASKTAGYAYDDWAIARMARAMGRSAIAERFERVPAIGATASMRRAISCARFSSGAFRTPLIRPRSTTERIIPRATPGNRAGSRRRIRPG